jgi:hypothetical protein
MRAAVVSTGPKFNGEGVLEYWVKAIKLHLHGSGCPADDYLRCARLCLEGAARDYVFSSGVALADLEDLVDLLRLRYGKSQQTALDEFYDMKQRPQQSAREYGDLL